ncbi:beta-lactamase [Mesobacillus campisalis]|uniref:Beta-lactamase n=2 Tax=Mesobacillus campisalis TaxID=1408103 RepID=A0A0M2SZS2_9BACI|nr:beta-lactamase [Mesobacillus campisalis]
MAGGVPNKTGTYVINDEKLTIVETGASPSVPNVLHGLKKLGFSPDDVKYIILTHIHLDHGGGAGLLLQSCPNAAVVVHPKAAKHIIDPSRLITGARMVFGEKFHEMYGSVLPVPENRILIKDDEETLEIGPNRKLMFFDSPGHASHHFSIYDPISNGMFAGDSAGIQLDLGLMVYLPATSPNQFDPGKMLGVIEQFRKMNLDRIYFAHFGMTTEVENALAEVKEWIPRFMEIGKRGLQEEKSLSDIANDIFKLLTNQFSALGVPDNHPTYNTIQLDLLVFATGIVDYLQKNKQKRV